MNFLLQGDAIAGITVALTVIPQGLAYAGIAGLPPQYGLYSAFMGCFVYVFFGTAKDITFGPTAIMSLMVGSFGKGKLPFYPLSFPFSQHVRTRHRERKFIHTVIDAHVDIPRPPEKDTEIRGCTHTRGDAS